MADSKDLVEAAYEAAHDALQEYAATLEDVKLTLDADDVDGLRQALPTPKQAMPHKYRERVYQHPETVNG